MEMRSSVVKTTRWAFTAFEAQFDHFTVMPPQIAEWGWQKEVCPKTNKLHMQGYLRTKQQTRFAALKAILPGVHLEPAKNWDALIKYCAKANTRAEGEEPQHHTSAVPTHYAYAEEVAQTMVHLHPEWRNWSTDEAWIEIDLLTKVHIASGRRGLEFIGSNPNWKTMWRSYWRPMFMREAGSHIT